MSISLLIHYLLFGYHPFSGEWTGAGESPDQTELIRKGFWYGGKNSLIRPSQTTIPLDVVHPGIKQLFLKCFNDGHASPKLRPTAEEWHNALQVAVNDLTSCDKIDSHHHSRNYGKCYWCERTAKLGVDIFPFVPGVSPTIIKPTTTQPTVIQIPSSTQISQTSKPTILQPLSNSPPTTLPSHQLPSTTNRGLTELQKAALTGSVIGTFLLIGLLLTRQQPLPTQSLPQQSVAGQPPVPAVLPDEDTSVPQQFEQPQAKTAIESLPKPSIPMMLGTWSGDFGLNNPSSTLVITRQYEKFFEGNLTTKGKKGGTFIIAIEGEINLETKEVSIRERRIIKKPESENWFLGTNLGVLSPDIHNIQGMGKDPYGNTYLWRFYKE